MNKKVYSILLLVILPPLAAILSSCFHEEDEEGSIFHCSYEVSSSGCNNSNYSAYEPGCLTVNTDNLRSDVNTDTYCRDTFPSSDTECSATCCVSFRYQNVVKEAGACPGESARMTALTNPLLAASASVLQFQLRFDAISDLDLALITPQRTQISGSDSQADGCRHSGDDRYTGNEGTESVSCDSTAIQADFRIVVSNNTAQGQAATLEVNLDGRALTVKQLHVDPGEPLLIEWPEK